MIECGECDKLFQAREASDRVEVEPGLLSVGIRCPHCRAFTHSYFEDQALRLLRDNTTVTGRKANRSKRHRRLHAAALERFAQAFDALQEKHAGRQRDIERRRA